MPENPGSFGSVFVCFSGSEICVSDADDIIVVDGSASGVLAPLHNCIDDSEDVDALPTKHSKMQYLLRGKHEREGFRTFFPC